MAPKNSDDKNEKNNPVLGIRYLSKRETQLVEELKKTRSEIVKELVHLGPELCESDIELWKGTLDAYRDELFSSNTICGHQTQITSEISKRRLKRLGKVCSLRDSNDKRGVKSRLDAFPILSASYSSRERNNPSSTIQLPVVTLPIVRRNVTSNSEKYREHDVTSKEIALMEQSNASQFKSVHFQDIGNSSAFIQEHLAITASDLADIQLYECKILQSADRDVGPIESGDEFGTTVFMAVVSSEDQVSDHMPHLKVGISLPTLAASQNSNTDLKKIHSTKYFASKSLGSSDSKVSTVGRNKSTRHVAHPPKGRSRTSSTPRRDRQAWSQYKMPTETNLRLELMESIGNMQRHTADVGSLLQKILVLTYVQCDR